MILPRPEHHEQSEVSAPLVVCTSQVSADLVSTMLEAHGIRTAGTWSFHAYPSLGWVEGYGVSVVGGQAEEARRILDALSRSDVLHPPPPDVDLDEPPPRPQAPPGGPPHGG